MRTVLLQVVGGRVDTIKQGIRRNVATIVEARGALDGLEDGKILLSVQIESDLLLRFLDSEGGQPDVLSMDVPIVVAPQGGRPLHMLIFRRARTA